MMFGKRTLVSAWVAAALGFGVSACSDDDNEGGSCEVSAWSSEGFEDNAAEALALREAIRVLQSDLMNAAEQETWGDAPTDPPSEQDLIDAYEAGSPSIADVTAPALDALVRQVLADWSSAMQNDPASYQFIDDTGSAWVAEGDGGVHERPLDDDGARRFRAYSASGVELRQIVDKGLFVGALYRYALSLTEGTITPATIHAIAAAWGANPSLNPTPGDTEPQNEDTAAYAYTMGLYDETTDALTAARAYAGNPDCTDKLDDAVVQVFRLWEEAAFARGTYYSGAPMRETLDPADPETVLEPLHGASEGYGLMAGMLGIENPASGPLASQARLSTDADIETALAALGLNILSDLSAGSTGEWLVESPTTYEDGFNGDYKDVMQTVFAWDDAQFTEYATTEMAAE